MAHRLPIAILLFTAAFGFSLTLGRAASAATPVVAVSPASKTVTLGDQFNLDITVANVDALPGIGGYVVAVHYDPAVLEMLYMGDSGFVTGGENIVICGAPEIDNAQGLAATYCQALPLFGAPGVSTAAAAALVNTTFKAKAAGTSGINLDDSYLESPQRIQITSTLVGGSVTVRAATATATAVLKSSATPAPSATAASATSTSTPAAATAVSTNAATATLSNVEAPTTGSGATGQSGAAWWIPTLTAVGAAMLGIGGLSVWGHRRRRA